MNCQLDRKAMDRSVYIHGTKFPNRIFVGGLAKSVDAKSLAEFFEQHGVVTEAKVIKNQKGYSRGYGFVTFSNASETEEVLNKPPIYYRGKRLNIGPAVRKQTPEIAGEDVIVISKQLSQVKITEPSTPQVSPISQVSPIPKVSYYPQPQTAPQQPPHYYEYATNHFYIPQHQYCFTPGNYY